ncbi:TIGR01244 family phosphatase [Roseibium denhamense]|uniref:TIGR01244 family protein n=1 Tax=Roseibium denhamense TaxID=76305 RepID=A0ABY1PLE3_9HYPH|nr:TIGR01244 family sulfur transferase [Roseibium denhamense]MTI07025.1 TIGR01244 family phosphatase [Roseibium denhamense]SMP36561.1 TIGR01244 family protein [Roseibium denhamense]
MNPNKLSADVSASGQIDPSDIAAIKELGFRSIICNRPDGEGADQPDFEEIRQAAEAAGLQARYLPVSPSGLTAADLEGFSGLTETLPKPILAYCRSGARSAALWQNTQ